MVILVVTWPVIPVVPLLAVLGFGEGGSRVDVLREDEGEYGL